MSKYNRIIVRPSGVLKMMASVKTAGGALMVAVLVSTSGCASKMGGGPILNRYGPVDTATTGLAGRFNVSATTAGATNATAGQIHSMLLDGFALVYASCSDFFQSSGRYQSWVITAKDAVGVASTLATGAVALKNGSDDTVAAIAFGSNAVSSGLDLYTRNYLFGAENVDAVRSLVTRAIATHQQLVLAANPTTYGDVTQALFDDQNYCAPRKIAALARDAIAAGTLQAYTPGDGLTQITNQADVQVLQELGRLVGLSGPVSTVQAGALWWLVKDSATVTEQTEIFKKLSALPTDIGPFNADGSRKSTWDLHDRVMTELNLLSLGSQKALQAWIADEKAAIAKATTPPGPNEKVPLVASPVNVPDPILPGTGQRSTRVEIGVRNR